MASFRLELLARSVVSMGVVMRGGAAGIVVVGWFCV